MDGLIVVKTGGRVRLDAVLSFALRGVAHETASAEDALPKLKNRRVLFAIGVDESGTSGELGALCLNKTFILPPRFCLMQTANDPGEAMSADGMETRIDTFADEMLKTILAKKQNV